MAARNIPMYKIMLSGRWKEVKTLTGYMKRINAKRSGTADLNKLLYSKLEAIESSRSQADLLQIDQQQLTVYILFTVWMSILALN